MAVLTESALRSQFLSKEAFDSVLKLPEGTILTPSAKSYLKERKIEVELVGGKQPPAKKAEENAEYMTTLYGDTLVNKGHKRIILRGKLDSLQSKIIEMQFQLAEKNKFKLADELSEILEFVRKLLEVEVTGKELDAFQLLNLTEKEIREMGQRPEDYYNVKLPLPDYRMGMEIVLLNMLRTEIRETEIAAYEAYKKEDGSMERTDILMSLNRLSSLCQIMMYKVKADEYVQEKEGKL
jgi:ethanolamine utilization cobalamin adenosyltransferase